MKPILASEIGMNKTEAKYCELLGLRKAAGEIVDFMWEPMKLTLTHNIKGKRNRMAYTPDFLVITGDRFEFHEVKGGFFRDDAKAKTKMAAELFPWFKFIIATLKGKRWTYEEF